MKLPNKKVLFVSLIIWLLISINYINRTIYFQRSHDFQAHLDYSHFIALKKRIPNGHEIVEAHNPFLYYLITSNISKQSLLSKDKTTHIYNIRLLSIFFGLIAISVSWFLLGQLNLSSINLLILLTYLYTTPKFLFIFSTYNNDSLSALLSFIGCLFTYMLYKSWSKINIISFFLISVLGLHTKHTFLIFLSALLIGFTILSLIGKSKFENKLITYSKKMLILIITSLITIAPYFYFNNIKPTGKFFPSANDSYVSDRHHTIHSFYQNIVKRIQIPKFTNEPWVWQPNDSKNGDYNYSDFLTVAFITSVIGEYTYYKPEVLIFWIILWIHLFLYLFPLSLINKDLLIRLLFGVIVIHYTLFLSLLGFVFDYRSCYLDFRYLSASYLPWIMIIGLTLNKLKAKSMLLALLLTGIFIHFYIILSCETNF